MLRYDPATGAMVDTFLPTGATVADPRVNNVAFGRDGTLLQFAPTSGAAGRYLLRSPGPASGTVAVVTDPASIFNATFTNRVGLTAFAVGPDGDLYVARSTATTGSIEKYSATTGLLLATVVGPATGFSPADVTDLAFAADVGLNLLTAPAPGAAGRLVAYVDPATGSVLRTFPLSATAQGVADHVVIGAAGVLFYAPGAAGAVRRFDLTTGEGLAAVAPVGLTASGYVIAVAPQDVAVTPVTVRNALPVVAVRTAAAAAGSYALTAVVTDAGTRDTLTYLWTISTGGAPVSGPTFTFTPTVTCGVTAPVTVTLTVTDDDAGSVATSTRVVFGTAAADTITLTNTAATVGATTTSYGPVSRVVVYGLAGNDTIDATAMTAAAGVPVELVGGAGADVLDVGAGNVFADGGADNDLYLIPMAGVVTLADGSGIDTVDVSGSPRAVRANLAAGSVVLDASNTVTFAPGAVENLTGTSFADVIMGSDGRNIVAGGGGLDLVDGGAGDDTLQGSFPSVVYLDFDTATGPGEHAYTVAERNLIQARLGAAFPAPLSVTFTQAPPATGRYSTVLVNGGA